MRVVVQRVLEASVKVNNQIVGKIDNGLLVFAGYEEDDNDLDIEWIARKIIGLRIFNDLQQVMNLSITEIQGNILLVSQFTLHASTKKGNRPSYIRSARPEHAIPLYNYFIQQIQSEYQKAVQTGEFGADMQVKLVNDGPVTIIIDSKNKDY